MRTFVRWKLDKDMGIHRKGTMIPVEITEVKIGVGFQEILIRDSVIAETFDLEGTPFQEFITNNVTEEKINNATLSSLLGPKVESIQIKFK